MSLNAAVTFGDPVRHKVGFPGIAGSLVGALKDQCPEVIAGFPGSESRRAVFSGDIAAHGMALVTVDTAFPLLEINRVAGKVPVD